MDSSANKWVLCGRNRRSTEIHPTRQGLQQIKKERNPGPRSFYLLHEPRQFEGEHDVQANAGTQNKRSRDTEDQDIDLTTVSYTHLTLPTILRV